MQRRDRSWDRPLGVFTTTGWKNVVSKFGDKSSDKRNKKQLKNKLDVLKKKYTFFMEFKNLATGLGWGEAKQTVVCSDEWWDEHLAICNNKDKAIKCPHLKFRKQAPKFLDDMHYIFDPSFSTEHARLRENCFWPYFRGAIGAIDGSHVKVKVPVDEVVNHTCRHGYRSQNVLAICYFDMRFNFVVAGWPDAAHDTRILNHALANFSSFPVPPNGKYYLVDSSYLNRIGYLAPYKGSTYHIPEFQHRTGPTQEKYDVFNFLHSSLRNVIERSFGVLKQKWRILKSIPSFSLRTQKHIIIACFALHNFIRNSKLRDKEFEKCDTDEQYLVPSTSTTTQTQDNESEHVENEDTMNTIREKIANDLVSARGG